MNESNLISRENEASRDDAALLPSVDVIEDAEGITLYADLPGVSKDKISIRVEADTLAIEGRIDLMAQQGLEVTHAEVQLPRYRRAFTLGPELNTAEVAAEFRQGVLKLRIPKAEHAKPRSIEVRVA
jgi:HSP20 family protein